MAYFPRRVFGIENEWYSHTTCVSICNDILLAAGLVLQLFLKCYCLKFEPTYNNKLSGSNVAELHLVREGETLYFILQLLFWKFRTVTWSFLRKSTHAHFKNCAYWVLWEQEWPGLGFSAKFCIPSTSPFDILNPYLESFQDIWSTCG